MIPANVLALRNQSQAEAQAWMAGISPGGRLTLETGVPVSITDQSAKTSLYYTPCVSNIIVLWDGTVWRAITFAETRPGGTTLTATSGKPYDVFAYLSSGVLALDTLVWTNDTTRATAVTLQDGRYCKSGDKTRLLLGTFYASATDQTSDTALLRYVSNVYNRELRPLKTGVQVAATGTYGTATWREWNNGTSVVRLRFVTALAQAPWIGIIAEMATASASGAECYSGAGVDSTSTDPNEQVGYVAGSATVVKGRISTGKNQGATGILAAGFHYIAPVQYASGGTSSFTVYWLNAQIMG